MHTPQDPDGKLLPVRQRVCSLSHIENLIQQIVKVLVPKRNRRGDIVVMAICKNNPRQEHTHGHHSMQILLDEGGPLNL